MILALIVCGLALLDVAPVFLRHGAFTVNANGTLGSVLSATIATGLGFFGFIALIVIFVIVVQLTKTPTTLYANVDELRQSKEGQEIIIPWNDVDSISASASDGKLKTYTVVAANGTEVAWSARSKNIAHRRRSYQRLTAGELAALVTMRSGKRVVIKQEDEDEDV